MTKFFLEKNLIEAFGKNQKIANIGFSHPKSKQFINAWNIKSINIATKFRLIFLHATGNDALFPQLSLFNKIADHGGEILTFDIDGHGLQSTTVFDPENIYENLTSTFNYLLKDDFSLPVFLVGQSLGGCLALNYLTQYKDFSEQIAATFLISVPIRIDFQQINRIKELSGFFTPSFFLQFKHYGAFGSFPSVNKFRRNEFPIRLSEPLNQLDYKLVISQFIEKQYDYDQIKNLQTSCYLIYGTRDTVSPVSDGQKLHESLRTSELISLEKSTHFTTMLNQECETYIINKIQSHL